MASNTGKNGKVLSTEENYSLGEIRINHSVIASIVRIAVSEIEGVHDVGGSLVDGLAEIFSKKETDRGVKVVEDENGNYVIDVRVIMIFGVSLARVALKIQESVGHQVKRMTMKDVAKVNVIIDGIKKVDTDKSRVQKADYLDRSLQ